MTTKSFLLYTRNKAPEDDSLKADMYGRWIYKWTNRWSKWKWCYFV